jgi:hypothetical protein
MGTTTKSNPSGLTVLAPSFAEEAARQQAERIAGSEALRHSEILQRLLRYLAEKSLSGEADQLKEYTIGLDLFGKGSEYDPRHDSSARIHVGRLRQKLAEYYASEGATDSILVTLPKGRFRLLFEERPVSSPAAPAPEPHAPDRIEPDISMPGPWRLLACGMAAALLLVIAWGIWSGLALRRLEGESADIEWTPQMEEFWGPFVNSDRPLVIAMGTPLFVGLQGQGVYRDMKLNRWEDAASSSNLQAIRKALGNPEIFPVHPYTGVGESKSAVLLGTLLVRHAHDIRFVRSIDLSWQQLADSNVILLGSTRTFGEALKALPVKDEILMEPRGLRIVSPRAGAPGFLTDEIVSANGSGLASLPDDGVAHALVEVLPNPNGKGYVAAFLSNLNSGVLAAVQYATDPNLLRQWHENLKGSSGRIPAYFQMALEVTSRGGVPISSRYATHREVHLDPDALGK